MPILENHADVRAFWHTNTDVHAFMYQLEEFPNYYSEVAEFARRRMKGWADCFRNLYAAVARRNIPTHQIRAGEESIEIGGATIHAIAPEESVQQRFSRYWRDKAGDPTAEKPDVNFLSAVLVVQWGDSAVLLGADAHRSNWETAIQRYIKLRLPKAVILKVPHHGSSDALNLLKGKHTYFDLCSHTGTKCRSVLFAGDVKHPSPKVYDRLVARTEVHCLINGIRDVADPPFDPGIPDQILVKDVLPCQPQVSFTVDEVGQVETLVGKNCSACMAA